MWKSAWVETKDRQVKVNTERLVIPDKKPTVAGSNPAASHASVKPK